MADLLTDAERLNIPYLQQRIKDLETENQQCRELLLVIRRAIDEALEVKGGKNEQV